MKENSSRQAGRPRIMNDTSRGKKKLWIWWRERALFIGLKSTLNNDGVDDCTAGCYILDIGSHTIKTRLLSVRSRAQIQNTRSHSELQQQPNKSLMRDDIHAETKHHTHTHRKNCNNCTKRNRTPRVTSERKQKARMWNILWAWYVNGFWVTAVCEWERNSAILYISFSEVNERRRKNECYYNFFFVAFVHLSIESSAYMWFVDSFLRGA